MYSRYCNDNDFTGLESVRSSESTEDSEGTTADCP